MLLLFFKYSEMTRIIVDRDSGTITSAVPDDVVEGATKMEPASFFYLCETHLSASLLVTNMAFDV